MAPPATVPAAGALAAREAVRVLSGAVVSVTLSAARAIGPRIALWSVRGPQVEPSALLQPVLASVGVMFEVQAWTICPATSCV